MIRQSCRHHVGVYPSTIYLDIGVWSRTSGGSNFSITLTQKKSKKISAQSGKIKHSTDLSILFTLKKVVINYNCFIHLYIV